LRRLPFLKKNKIKDLMSITVSVNAFTPVGR